MRYSVGLAVLSLVALAGCATPADTAKAPPAAATAADDSQQTASAVKKPKNCIVGTRMCTTDKQVDPSVAGMSGEALGDAQRGHVVSGQIVP